MDAQETGWSVQLNTLTVATGLNELSARLLAAGLIDQASARAYPEPGAWRDKAGNAKRQMIAGAADWAKVSQWFISVKPNPEFTIRSVQLESAG
jgi:hypothetical protein